MSYEEWQQCVEKHRRIQASRVCVICRQIKEVEHFEGSVGRCRQCFFQHTPLEARNRMRRAVGLKEGEEGEENAVLSTVVASDFAPYHTCDVMKKVK